MILYKPVDQEFIKKHGNIYCIACRKRGMRVQADFIPCYPNEVSVAKEFASCEFHIDESELFLTRRILQNGRVACTPNVVLPKNFNFNFKEKRKHNDQKKKS